MGWKIHLASACLIKLQGWLKNTSSIRFHNQITGWAEKYINHQLAWSNYRVGWKIHQSSACIIKLQGGLKNTSIISLPDQIKAWAEKTSIISLPNQIAGWAEKTDLSFSSPDELWVSGGILRTHPHRANTLIVILKKNYSFRDCDHLSK